MKIANNLIVTFFLIVLLIPSESIKTYSNMKIGFFHAVTLLPDIKYGNNNKQALDIFIPSGKGKFPVMFFVHGGAWSSGDRYMYRDGGYFYAKNGYITVIIDHQLSPNVKHPEHIKDVAKAFSWVKKNISFYRGDSEKIYICGHSSGSHLVTLLASNKKYLENEDSNIKDIKGVIAISGIYKIGINVDIAGYKHVFPTIEDKYDASPINFINKDMPPFLILYAECDLLTFPRQSIDLHNILKNKGIKSEIHCVKGKDHSTILLSAIKQDSDTAKTILNFMK